MFFSPRRRDDGVALRFFGEDAGQRQFLAAYLLHCGSDATGVAFEPVAYFGKQFGPMNNLVVDRRCADACQQAFMLGYPILNLLFVGRDVDSFEVDRYQYLSAKLRANIPEEWHGRTLLLLPVQCIEHWLLYLAQHPSREVRERTPNDQVKHLVYSDTTVPRDEIRRAIVASLSPERIAWLAEVSASFRDFNQQVHAYLAALALNA